MSTSPRPRWTLDADRRRGETAYALAIADRATIEARLSAGVIDALRADLDALSGAAAASGTKLGAQIGATAAERELAKEAHDLVHLVREAAKRRGGAALQKDLGVGDGLKHSDTSEVLSALAAVVRAAGANGADLAPIGIQPAEVAEASALGQKLSGADGAQWKQMIERKSGTADTVALRLRVERAVDEIGTAGQVAFRKSAERRAEYEKLFHHAPHEAAPDAPPADAPAAAPPEAKS
jgi:hypothetical protein